jgi:predicted nucleic-acid-binding protein
MIGLDTNTLVRFVTWDDAKQAEKVATEVSRAKSRGVRLCINDLVLAELIWVLRTSYEKTKPEIIIALEALLETAQFEWEDKQLVTEALHDFSATSADFTDCLIGRKNLAAGCAKTLSFDKSVKPLGYFEFLKI